MYEIFFSVSIIFHICIHIIIIIMFMMVMMRMMWMAFFFIRICRIYFWVFLGWLFNSVFYDRMLLAIINAVFIILIWIWIRIRIRFGIVSAITIIHFLWCFMFFIIFLKLDYWPSVFCVNTINSVLILLNFFEILVFFNVAGFRFHFSFIEFLILNIKITILNIL